jgi:hypothetical protein
MEKLHKEDLHICYCLPGIIREINIRKMKLVRNVACVGGMRNERTYFQAENLRRRGHLKIPRVRGSVILKWIFKKIGWNCVDLSQLPRIRTSALMHHAMILRVP